MIVRHHAGEYPVHFTSLAEAPIPKEATWITDENVARCGPTDAIVLPPGEASKCLEVYGELLRQLAQRGLKRGGHLVALGGGVIGDLVGFVAATYMRGVRYTQVPTSLLAMVDSSVGGKVGIDLPEGKNLVGAFHPPAAVIVDMTTLQTLPEIESRNGMAEVLKYGFIHDPEVLTMPFGEPLIRRCIEIKKEVVEADEFETKGIRATLNYGHTLGHALEVLTGYSALRHGEAISVGMVWEARLGEQLGVTPPGTEAQVRKALAAAGLPTDHPMLADVEPMLAAMARDKKAGPHGLPFSLLTRVGECKLYGEVPVSAVRDLLTLA